MKRGIRGGVEDRWHRGPRKGEPVEWPADASAGRGVWCIDPKHGDAGTLVATARHGHGRRWLARWVDDDGNERSKAFDRKAEAQAYVNRARTAIDTGTYADPRRSGLPPVWLTPDL